MTTLEGSYRSGWDCIFRTVVVLRFTKNVFSLSGTWLNLFLSLYKLNFEVAPKPSKHDFVCAVRIYLQEFCAKIVEKNIYDLKKLCQIVPKIWKKWLFSVQKLIFCVSVRFRSSASTLKSGFNYLKSSFLENYPFLEGNLTRKTAEQSTHIYKTIWEGPAIWPHLTLL